MVTACPCPRALPAFPAAEGREQLLTAKQGAGTGTAGNISELWGTLRSATLLRTRATIPCAHRGAEQAADSPQDFDLAGRMQDWDHPRAQGTLVTAELFLRQG